MPCSFDFQYSDQVNYMDINENEGTDRYATSHSDQDYYSLSKQATKTKYELFKQQ